MPYTDVADYLGVDTTTLLHWMIALEIPVYRFTGDFRTFLAHDDAHKIKKSFLGDTGVF